MKLFLIICICCFFKLTASNFCYWNTGCPYKYLSTETPYNSVRGDIRDSIVRLRGCEPVSIWGIYRHGKREPGAKFAESMKQALPIRNYITTSYKKGRSSLCAQDVENLQNWQLNQNTLNGKSDLTEEGRQEMLGLSKRLKEVFPDLLSELRNGDYSFRSASGSWIEKSIQHFVKGLGDDLTIEKVKAGADVMAPYATCGSYQKDVQRNPNIYVEAAKYMQNSEYLATKDRIQRRTGIDYMLTDDNITALYDLCRYTWSAVDNKFSPWCAVFTKDDLEVLEYIQDLKHYYRNGYGTSVNELFGRVPLANLLESFESAKKGHGKKIVTYVTHATMLDQIYTALGLFKDSAKLNGLNRDRERKWRSSKISVFSANLIAVLNRCTDNSEDYNVVFYLNEEPMRSICEEGVCSWREFENKLRPFINTTIDFCEFRSEPY
ncbi:multiple inositol polyphosphate phosphatase 1-like isoform X2 [Danaus plexippus]|uniref:multiple inositol polyphosphate phosphatase 1-like isoform X2 n=1 Tax=Danaus plexippus TaxID=13037 RepID=UPI000239D30D|nr:multiple inositol polyphosphate phosphatase 1-like isoform X2 [Danaus plexippus]